MENKIYKQITAAQADIKAIGKNQQNIIQHFKYRGIDDIYDALQPIMQKHLLFTVPEILEEKSEERQTRQGGLLIYRVLKIKYTVYTDDGSFISGVVIGEAMDSGDKAANKAMAVAHKYFLTQLFTIPTSDDDDKDPDGQSYELKNNNENINFNHITENNSKDNYQKDVKPNPHANENIMCEKCGNKMLISKFRDKNNNIYYYCSNKQCGNKFWPK